MASASNYWLMLVTDLAGAVLLLWLGLARFQGGLLPALAIGAAGALSWGTLEYAIHRWVLHGPPSTVQRAHARHHQDATALISAPALLSTTLVTVVWALVGFFIGAAPAALLVGGLYAGYNYYALVHHVQHQHPALVTRIGWLSRLDRAHRIHHRRYVINYGVTTEWLDRLLHSDGASREATARGAAVRPRTRGVRWPWSVMQDDAQS